MAPSRYIESVGNDAFIAFWRAGRATLRGGEWIDYRLSGNQLFEQVPGFVDPGQGLDEEEFGESGFDALALNDGLRDSANAMVCCDASSGGSFHLDLHG